MGLLSKAAGWIRHHAWLLLLLGIIGLFLYPVAYRSSRLLLLVCLGLFWGLSVIRLRRHRIAQIAVLAVSAICLGFLCLPGRPVDVGALRQGYVNSLKRYEGTLYFWGGENRIGIDCSGLVRRGLINANVRLGLSTLNPTPMRTALSLWWHDCSARALRDEYRGYTLGLSTANSINDADHNSILPGDMAVTTDGIHILAYIGNKEWIAADPGAMRVLIEVVPSNSPWFSRSIRLIRWSQLTENNATREKSLGVRR